MRSQQSSWIFQILVCTTWFSDLMTDPKQTCNLIPFLLLLPLLIQRLHLICNNTLRDAVMTAQIRTKVFPLCSSSWLLCSQATFVIEEVFWGFEKYFDIIVNSTLVKQLHARWCAKKREKLYVAKFLCSQFLIGDVETKSLKKFNRHKQDLLCF